MLKITTLNDVRHLFQTYHGYGDAGGSATYCFALYEGDELVAAFTWQPPAYGAAKAVCPEAPAGVLSLSRMVAVPRNEREHKKLSIILRQQFNLIDRGRWPVLITYSDEGQGHNGWVYRCARMKKTSRKRVRIFEDANGIRRSSLSNGKTTTVNKSCIGYTHINRWEKWACPRGFAAAWMRGHGWKREPIPGKTWASGNQAHRWINTR